MFPSADPVFFQHVKSLTLSCLSSVHPYLWVIGRSVHDGPEVLDELSIPQLLFFDIWVRHLSGSKHILSYSMTVDGLCHISLFNFWSNTVPGIRVGNGNQKIIPNGKVRGDL